MHKKIHINPTTYSLMFFKRNYGLVLITYPVFLFEKYCEEYILLSRVFYTNLGENENRSEQPQIHSFTSCRHLWCSLTIHTWFDTFSFAFAFNVVLFKNLEFCQEYADKREHKINKIY